MLDAVVREAAQRFGDDPAFVTTEGWALSFADLDRLSDEVASALMSRGIGDGSIVGLALPSCPEHVVAYAAAAKVGAVTAPVNARLAAAERADAFDLVGPDLILATADLAPQKGAVVEVVLADHADAILEDLRDGDASPAALEPDGSRPVAVVFTSGTTGKPKAAVFTARRLAAITSVDVADAWGDPDPAKRGRMMAATSLAHVGFMTKLPWYIRLGGPTFLMPRWRASDVLHLIERERITSLGGVPTQMALLLREPDFDARDLSSVATIVLGGGPATVGLLREASERVGAPISLRYSSTETGGCGTGTAFDDPFDSSVGVGLPRGPITVAIRDEDGRALPEGEVGEVCVSTPTAFAGYFGDPHASAAAFTADGAVRTGDLGRLDETGRLHLAGRAKEMYVRGGYNVYPAEVEAVLAEHPGVAAVAVVPRPDELMGELGVAVVVPQPGAQPTLAELRSFAAERIGSHKLPDDVRLVGSLPVTPMDKVDKTALAELVR